MSSSETVTFKKGPCPCGAGHIAHHVTSQDNPWSGVDHSYSIACSTCAAEWRIEPGVITLRSSEAGYKKARVSAQAAFEHAQNLAEVIVADCFKKYAAKNKKAEHAEMLRLAITGSSYLDYLKYRREGRTLAQATSALSNEASLLAEARRVSVEPKLKA